MSTDVLPYAWVPARAAERWPDRPALTFNSREWSYAEFEDAVARASSNLSTAGVRHGDRVVLLMENRPEYIFAQFALARLGAAFVIPNPHWTEHELRAATAPLGATTALYSPRHDLLAAEFPLAIPVSATTMETCPAGGRRPGANRLSTAKTDALADTELCIPFSSGTTGLPKGVIHTHQSLSGGIHQLVTHLGLTEDDRLQISLPLCHIFGTSMVGAALAVGAHATLFERFDFDTCLAQVREDRVTVWPLAGAVAHRLANTPGIGRDMFPELRFFMWGGSAAPVSLATAITNATGVGFLCSYGMTEAFCVAFNPVDDPESWRLDSPGFATRGTDIRLTADSEIEVRGPCVARGYASISSDSFLPDGWFRTGDVGRIDSSGRVFIVDRRKDMIKVSGFQVAPAEVEAELIRHPAVTDAAVIGAPDERRGERVIAFVVLVAPLSSELLREALSVRLATYKLPTEVIPVESLPRTDAGKLQRARLRDQLHRKTEY